MNFKSYIYEARKLPASRATNTYTKAKTKEEFLTLVDDEFPDLKKIPKIYSTDIRDVLNKLNQIPKTKSAMTLMSTKANGIGPGEFFFVYFVDGVPLGGGNQNYDIDLNGKYEIKARGIDKAGYTSFRVGKGSSLSGALRKHDADLRALLMYGAQIPEVLKKMLSASKAGTYNDLVSQIQRSEVGMKVMDPIRNLRINPQTAKINFEFNKNLDYFRGASKLGNVNDKNFKQSLIDNIKFSTVSVKDFDTIESEVQASVQKYYNDHKIKYIIISENDANFYLIDTVETIIERLSQGSLIFKMKV